MKSKEVRSKSMQSILDEMLETGKCTQEEYDTCVKIKNKMDRGLHTNSPPKSKTLTR